MGASDFQLFRFVLLPAAFPIILTACGSASPWRSCPSSAAKPSPHCPGSGTASCSLARAWIWRACSPTSRLRCHCPRAQHHNLHPRGSSGAPLMSRAFDIPQPSVPASLAHRFKQWMLARPGVARLGVIIVLFIVWSWRRASSSTSSSSAHLRWCSRNSTPYSKPAACRRHCGSPPWELAVAFGMSVVIGVSGRTRDRVAAVRHQELDADRPPAVWHAADHHPAAVHPVFRHRARLQGCVRRTHGVFPIIVTVVAACRTSSQSS